MSNVNEDIVDLEALEFDDDIEEIVISDYSGEEEDETNKESLEYNTKNASGSELKISSVVSCSELAFGGNCGDGQVDKIIKENDLLYKTETKPNICALVGNEESSDGSNFSYDSLTDDEGKGDSKHAALERQRRKALRGLYQDLWESISSEPLNPACSKFELLSTSYDMIRKLTVAGRKLQYSAELCLQSNYRLKRKIKRLTKKKRKSVDSRDGTKPGKVVTSRASI
uniref:BHLH domain-containing protein n=1 Tax=Rhodnius prolixus TaxID=13249 RepID=T1IAH3_RHOPR